MDHSSISLNRIGTLAAYVLLGVVVTAVVALGTLYVLQPIQKVIYNAFYLQIGPSEATETAILAHFFVAAIAGSMVSYAAGGYLSTRQVNPTALGAVVLGMVGLLVVFLMVALAQLAAFLTAILVLSVGFAGIPLVLRYRHGVRSGGIPAFVGGIPVVVLLLLLAGFGLGWGWGYVVTAQEVPASSVTGEVASFDDVPQFERDLFTAGYCREELGDRYTCSLELRGYEHEVATARFMARHGVHCPYEGNTNSGEPSSFVARHNGTYYRITCTPYGD